MGRGATLHAISPHIFILYLVFVMVLFLSSSLFFFCFHSKKET